MGSCEHIFLLPPPPLPPPAPSLLGGLGQARRHVHVVNPVESSNNTAAQGAVLYDYRLCGVPVTKDCLSSEELTIPIAVLLSGQAGLYKYKV
jgi:hypothetical protein